MKTEAIRKVCPKCGRRIKLNKDGVFLGHLKTKPKRKREITTFSGGITFMPSDCCNGSFTTPPTN